MDPHHFHEKIIDRKYRKHFTKDESYQDNAVADVIRTLKEGSFLHYCIPKEL